MRRTILTLAAAALAVSGFAGAAQADVQTICVGNICVCVQAGGCPAIPAPGGRCVRVDLDNNGSYETVCV
jgi:hypothetical protein